MEIKIIEQWQPGEWLAQFIGNSLDNIIPAIFTVGLFMIVIALVMNLSPPVRFPRLFK